MTLAQFTSDYGHVVEEMTRMEYFNTIYIPVMIWILILIILYTFLLIKYTFGKRWTEESPNPYQDETLGLPRGMFRGTLTLSLLFIGILLEITNIRLGNDEGNIREFMVAFQMMIAFYFGSKVLHHVTSTEKKKAMYRAEAAIKSSSSTETTSTVIPPNVFSSVAPTDVISNPTVANQASEMYSDESDYYDEEAAG